MANATVTMVSPTDGKQSYGVHGLHLLSTVVDSFLHGNIQNAQSIPIVPIETRHCGFPCANLPLVSACSIPTENVINSKSNIYSSLHEKARSIGKSKSAMSVRASRPKVPSYKNPVLGDRSKIASNFTTGVVIGEDKPNWIPPSPPIFLQEQYNHKKIQELYLQHAKGLVEKLTTSAPLMQERAKRLLYAPILQTNENKNISKTSNRRTSSKMPVTTLLASGELGVSKTTMAELNYIKHKAVPMREKWMARFLELADFKEKYGHTKVPHNFPDSPKLAEWQKFQRQQRKLFIKGKHSQLTPERVVMLERIGFVWEARIDAWESHYQNLQQFKKTHSHIYVPVANTVLSQWVKRQRKQYKKYQKGQESSLTEDRIDRLNKLGFIWDGRHLNY